MLYYICMIIIGFLPGAFILLFPVGIEILLIYILLQTDYVFVHLLFCDKYYKKEVLLL